MKLVLYSDNKSKYRHCLCSSIIFYIRHLEVLFHKTHYLQDILLIFIRNLYKTPMQYQNNPQWTFPLSDKILKKIEIGKNITIA